MALIGAAVVSGQAWAAPAVIQDGFVKAGVSDFGTLGSNDTASPGILYDPTGTSNDGINDFLTPGTPRERFYITGQLATGAPYSEFSNNTSAGAGIMAAPPSLPPRPPL